MTLIVTHETLSDGDGFYQKREYYYDSQKYSIFCIITERNTYRSWGDLRWRKELLGDELNKFLENENLPDIARDIKLKKLNLGI